MVSKYKPWNIHSRNSKYRKELSKNATSSELKVKQILSDLNIKFYFQKGFLVPFHRIVDFYLPFQHLIIEVDGEYHTQPAQKLRDLQNDAYFLKHRHIKTARIKNEEVTVDNIKKLLEAVF